MTSNAYIASDGVSVMKVGKANDVQRRERQIGVSITVTVACLDQAAAFRVESRLRDFVIEQGGIRHQGTVDWFKFDPQIYAMLCEFAQGIDAKPAPELDLDTEIQMLVARYRQLITHEAYCAINVLGGINGARRHILVLEIRLEYADFQIKQLKAYQERQTQEMIRLSQEKEILKLKLEQLEKNLPE